MDLSILGIFGEGTSNERLTLVANGDCDLSNYVVIYSLSNQSPVSNAIRLPKRTIKEDDQVKIYAREGIDKTVSSISNNCNLHLLYLGIKLPFWRKKEDYTISLIEIKNENKII